MICNRILKNFQSGSALITDSRQYAHFIWKKGRYRTPLGSLEKLVIMQNLTGNNGHD